MSQQMKIFLKYLHLYISTLQNWFISRFKYKEQPIPILKSYKTQAFWIDLAHDIHFVRFNNNLLFHSSILRHSSSIGFVHSVFFSNLFLLQFKSTTDLKHKLAQFSQQAKHEYCVISIMLVCQQSLEIIP